MRGDRIQIICSGGIQRRYTFGNALRRGLFVFFWRSTFHLFIHLSTLDRSYIRDKVKYFSRKRRSEVEGRGDRRDNGKKIDEESYFMIQLMNT